MVEILAEGDEGWIRPLAAGELNAPVLGIAALQFFGILFGGGAFIAVLASGGKPMFVITGAVGLVYLFGLAIWGMKFLGALVSTYGSPRSATMSAVRSGQIAPTYVLHDAWHISIIAVDENRRLMTINGRLVRFGEIREVRWSSTGSHHALEFVLRSGKNPIIHLDMRSANLMRQNYERLANTLELS